MCIECKAGGFVVCVCVCVLVCVYSPLMSYTYGALSKARNSNAVCNGPTFGNADNRLYLLQSFSTLIQ